MSTAKDEMIEIIKKQPDNSSYDELLRELAFKSMVDKGMKDSEIGNTISNDEMLRQRIESWKK